MEGLLSTQPIQIRFEAKGGEQIILERGQPEILSMQNLR